MKSSDGAQRLRVDTSEVEVAVPAANTSPSGVPPSPSGARGTVRKRPPRKNSSLTRRGTKALNAKDHVDNLSDNSGPTTVESFCVRMWKAIQEYIMYHFWLPLTGLVATGSAFTVPPWLAIPDLVVGIVLIHSKLLQALVKNRVAFRAAFVQAEKALCAISFLLSLMTLVVRIAETSGDVWIFDGVFVGVSLLGAICAGARHPDNVKFSELHQVPAAPVLLLAGTAATLVPTPSAAALPYLLFFLTQLDAVSKYSWRRLLTFPMRLTLLILTTLNLCSLLTLNFLGWAGYEIPVIMIGIFGPVGRTVVQFRESITRCVQPNPPQGLWCPSREESLWPGIHLGAVMLMHFVLTNVDEGHFTPWFQILPARGSKLLHKSSSNTSMSSLTDETQETVSHTPSSASYRAMRFLEGAFHLVLLIFALSFPSLLTLPLLFQFVRVTFTSSSAAEYAVSCCAQAQCIRDRLCCRRCCARRRHETDPDSDVSRASGYEDGGCFVNMVWARYAATVFLLLYVFQVVEVFLHRNDLDADSWLLDELASRTAALPLGLRFDVARLLRLEPLRLDDLGSAVAEFFPKALLLIALALLKASLELTFLKRAGQKWFQYLDNTFQGLWVHFCQQTAQELAMLLVLLIVISELASSGGLTSSMVVCYGILLGKLVYGRLQDPGQPKAFKVLQAVASVGVGVMALLYLLVVPENVENTIIHQVCPYRLDGQASFWWILMPHLAVIVICWLERLRIAKACTATTGGRARAETQETVDSSVSVESPFSVSSWRPKSWFARAVIKVSSVAVDKIRKWTDELICIFVLVLAFSAALVPGIDIHSLALLLGTGPAMLLYNTETQQRSQRLDRGYWILRLSTALMFAFRIFAASPLIPWPTDQGWPITLSELGVNRPMADPPIKVALLGIIPIACRLAILATLRVQREESKEARREERKAKQVEVSLPPVAEEAEVRTEAIDRTDTELQPSEIDADIPEEHRDFDDVPASTEEQMESIRTPPDRLVRFAASPSRRMYEVPSTTSLSGDYVQRTPKKRRYFRGPRMEERVLTWLIPSWMEFLPLQAHVYLSALLLVLVFGLSMQEVNVLNFLMIVAVICLCGWSQRWVQAGNLFSMTSLTIMCLQYLARFSFFDEVQGGTINVWLARFGLQWTSSQVEKHCAILAVCILQKQCWYRGRFSQARPVVCPRFVADHADMAGFFALISVAVVRRHIWSSVLVLGALPWVIMEELPWKGHLSSKTPVKTKGWLRWFRFVLFVVLFLEVSMRLLLNFELGEQLGRDSWSDWMCQQLWTGAALRDMNSCLSEFTRWFDLDETGTTASSANPLMLIEFFCLFGLGIVQQLLECVKPSQDEPGGLQRKKLTVLYWWPLLVWLCDFLLSLARGTLLGLCFLLLFFGKTFNNSSDLACRIRWVWRSRLAALLFLIVGLGLQSPLVPCSRASCENNVHQIYMTIDKCAFLEGLNISTYGSEAASSNCGETDAALGHDTTYTLAVQFIGLQRVHGNSVTDGLFALLFSQLGQLVFLIVATTVQLRMYSNPVFSRYADVLVREPEEVMFARARRFVHEFYCGVKLEERASKGRMKALVEKLHRTKQEIKDILDLRIDNTNDRNNVRRIFGKDDRDVAIEELQLSHGLSKKEADKVMTMFACKVDLGKQYAYLLQQVTLGRLKPDGFILRQEVEKLLEQLQVFGEIAAGSAKRSAVSARVLGSSWSSSSSKGSVTSGLSPARSRSSSQDSSGHDDMQVMEDIEANLAPYTAAISQWWEGFKSSQVLTHVMCDHAFLGLDEEHYQVSADRAASEELSEHRRGNNVVRLLWKALLSNMIILIAIFSTLAFIWTRSIMDVLRLVAVIFWGLRKYPFPDNRLWTALKVFSAGLLFLRTIYDLPFLCAGFEVRRLRPPAAQRLEFEPDESYDWCPVFTQIGVDILLGFAKRATASALNPETSWLAVVWADHLCIWAILTHEWMLERYGIGKFAIFDQQSQRVWLRGLEGAVPYNETCDIKDNNLGQWGHRFREEHTELVKRWWELRKDFIKEFRKQDTLFHEYQEQGSDTEEMESEDVPSEGCSEEESGDEADAEPADPGVRTPAASSVRAAGEAEAEATKSSEASPSQAAKPRLNAEAEISSEASPAGSLALQDKIPSRTLSLPSSIARSASMSTVDTGLVMSATRTLQQSEWSSWFKVKVSTRKGFGLFTKSCRPPRELSTAPPRLLFPVLRAVDALEQPKGLQPLDAEEIEALREEQALRWAQVLASRFLARRARLYARTGHHLVASRLSDRVAACESCATFISPSELHWSCPSCVFNICKTCAGDIMAGKRPRGKLMKPGISLYSAKYGLSLVMLCYALLNNKAVLKEEERSFSQSLQESSFSVATLLLIVAHLTMLISDRIFFKAHYSTRSKRTLHIIELISMVIFLAEFVFLHWHTIAILWTSVNAREATISLASDFELCIYYICGMLYLIICMLQVKHSLPSLSNDSLRPKTSSLFSASSIISEKIRYFAFMIHYNMPFVDDIRIIVDWTVAPTSLDLWMYWKVEDAHTAFYRSRHVMFVRSQSYYAEERDPLEKIYSGWAILCLVVLVILMPIIVFSPFSPFPNTVLIDEATLSLELTVASACYGMAHERELCRYVALQLFESPASQIQNYNSSAKQQYLRDNPRVNTDIDIQDVMWPWYSQGRLKASPAAVTEVQRLLDHAEADDGTPVALAYVLRYTLQRAVLGSTEYVKSVCSCSPAETCGQGDDSMWPSRIIHLCRPTAATSDVSQTSVSEPMDLLINQSRDWWREASTAGSEEARITLPKIWSRSVNLGNDGLTPQASAMEDFFYGIAPANTNCSSPSGLVSCARHRWGRLWSNILVPDPDNSSEPAVEEPTPLRLQVELEKSVNVQGVTGEASSSYTSALGLYAAVVLVAGKYLRAAFQGASKQAIYDEIPDAHVFLDIIEAIKMAREHNDLRIEFELYYCLMQVLRSTHILLRTGGHQPRVYGIGRAKQEHIKGDVDEEVVRL